MRYKELDGLRGIAALTVYFSHLIGVFDLSKNQYFNTLQNSPLHIFWDGASAVNLFFLLSGFVLTSPYLKDKNKINLASFYTKRIFRIYPAFFFSILFCIITKEFLFHPFKVGEYSYWINDFWKWNLIKLPFKEFINTIILVGKNFNSDLFNPVVWTLRVEMIMSFILPFFIFVALRTKLIFNLIFIAILFLCGKYTSTIFYLGIILAIYGNSIVDYLNFKVNLFFIIILVLVATFFYTSRFSLNININWLNVLLSTIGSALIVLLAFKNGIFNRILKSRPILFLGNVSYSFYLLHFPVLLVSSSLLENYKYLIFPISLSVSLFLSHLVYTFIEIPLIRVGKYIKFSTLDLSINKMAISFEKKLKF
jgi:hypothetical protein